MAFDKYITNKVKDALILALSTMGEAPDGTEIQDVVSSGEDAFEKYPTIRVVPASVNRNITADVRYRDYEMMFVISVYLEMGDTAVPDADIIATMNDLIDMVYYQLDTTDWLPEDITGLSLVNSAVASVIDTTPSKTGTAIYCDIMYPVTYRVAV